MSYTFDNHKNLVSSTVVAAPTPATSGTSLALITGTGANFPTPPFNCVVCPFGYLPNSTNTEIVRVTAISGDTVTIVRAQEGSTAQPIADGYIFYLGVTAKSFTDIETAINTLNQLPDITDDDAGHVGINNSTPVYAMDVNGILGNSSTDSLQIGNFNRISDINGVGGSWTMSNNSNPSNLTITFDYPDNNPAIYSLDSSNGDNLYPLSIFGNNILLNPYPEAWPGVVGIATSTPVYPLDVNGIIGNSATNTLQLGLYTQVQDSIGTGANLSLQNYAFVNNTEGAAQILFSFDGPGPYLFASGPDYSTVQPFMMFANPLLLTPGYGVPGNVGIGTVTTYSGYALDIGGWLGSSTADLTLDAFVGGEHNVILQPIGGNVGINLTSPIKALDVSGGIRFDTLESSNWVSDGGIRLDAYGNIILSSSIGYGYPYSWNIQPDGGNIIFRIDAFDVVPNEIPLLINSASGALFSFANTLDDGVGNTYIAGNLGVRTTGPVWALDVNGDIGTSTYGHDNYINLDDTYGNSNWLMYGNATINPTNGHIGLSVSAPQYTVDVGYDSIIGASTLGSGVNYVQLDDGAGNMTFNATSVTITGDILFTSGNTRFKSGMGWQFYNSDTGLWHTKLCVGDPPQDGWDAGEA